jgi:DNA-binding NarL/FixJ family response regulator
MKKSTKNKIKILVVDDQPLFRRGLESILRDLSNEYTIVGSVENGLKAVEFCRKNKVDIITMDIEMPVMDGIDATEKILEENPDQNILILSMHDEPTMMEYCIKLGARGFLSKSAASEELGTAINSIIESGYYFNEKFSKAMIGALLKKSEIDPKELLSDREKEIIRLISEEKNMSEIAEELNVSVRTIETHRNRILEKTGAKNMVGVIMYAIRNNLIS